MLNFIKSILVKIWTPTVKRYIISSAVTFATTFLFVISVGIRDLEWSTISWATISGLVVVGLRAAAKALLEFIIAASTPKKDAPVEPPK